ncbi:UNVERIFIED_CONTAM: hypothetical protein PYX00_010046 [Menopon gallinae]|uniref:NOT2/NOT3/NOT5 C-terminal domain-containing protein n=1 Tax=Menopon gallinae TaxID=328185 RepID=A0AAW2HDY6_9NEOP
MSGKDNTYDYEKADFSVTEKKSMPNLEASDRPKLCHQPPKRKSRHLYKYQTPSFSTVSRGLEMEPPAFPPLDLMPFDTQNIIGGQGDMSGVGADMTEATHSPRPEFKMVREDFPALPGTQNDSLEYGYQLAGGESTTTAQRDRRGGRIETHADGRVSNIPRSMVQDQYGIAGLLSFLRAAEYDKTLEVQGLGEDLTTYGFDLNAKDMIHPNFSGPFADFPAQPQDLDYDVPKEYLHHRKTKKKLPAVDFSRYNDDTLFYLFYTFVGDYKQLMAAAYLYDKEWRFHTEENYWMSLMVDQKNSYCFFDPTKWCKVRVIDYEIDIQKLAARPHVPNVSPPKQDLRNNTGSQSSVQICSPVQQQMQLAQQPLQVMSVPVRPAYPFLGAYNAANNFTSRHNIPTVFTPCPAIIGAVTPRNAIPVVPSRALPVMSPYSRYNLQSGYNPPRNITTLYAPAPVYTDATERLRRKKRH